MTTNIYEPHKVLITGGLGFIGSNLINYLVPKYPNILFVNLDRLDYVASLKNVTVSNASNYRFVQGDMGDTDLIRLILQTYEIDTIMNLAAQSSVDHSDSNSRQHVLDNVVAVHNLLEATRQYGKITRFVHISTDETYGDQKDGVAVHEESILMPNNVYSATKGCGELLCRAYRVSYKIPLILTKGNNIYGPRQYPEKVWPRFCLQLLKGEQVTIHGTGETRRSFLHVSDKVRALETIMFHGEIGNTYNIGTDREMSVLEVADALRKRICPDKTLDEVIKYIPDRPFNDSRYVITFERLQALGWKEEVEFAQGIDDLVAWYREHGETQWL